MKIDIILELLKVVLPVVITGLFTFFVTKYTYSKNIPLDKLEITYNRVYYPIYIVFCFFIFVFTIMGEAIWCFLRFLYNTLIK